MGNNCYIPQGIFLRKEECLFNCREKICVNNLGEVISREVMYSKYPVFNPNHVELHNGQRIRAKEEWERCLDEMYDKKRYVSEFKENPIEKSKKRAKKKLIDYILCNNFDLFATITINPEKLDSKNYSELMKKLKSFLDNRVRRNGLIYVGVPELHKNGGIHFHFLMNSEAVELVDSGTVKCDGKKKPIKVATADRQNIPLDNRKTVYNIPSWKFGFTTAIMTDDNVQAVANYIGKYITKGTDKVGGRWYYSGGKLCKPIYNYSNKEYDKIVDYDYSVDKYGGGFKVKIYVENL